jgi:hypothetical protein
MNNLNVIDVMAACADRQLHAPPQGPPPAAVTINIVSDIVVQTSILKPLDFDIKV